MTEEKTIIDLAKEFNETGDTLPLGVVPEKPTGPPNDDIKEGDTAGLSAGSVPDILRGLLKNVEEKTAWVKVDLPSLGLAYQGVGAVEIRAFTFKEEKLLRSIIKVSDGKDVIRKMFTNCVRGVSYDALTVPDKNFLLFKLREISYGNDYPVILKCENCGTDNRMKVEIGQIPVKFVAKDYAEPFKFTLPDSNVEVFAISPRAKDEDFLATGETLVQNLWRFVRSVGGYKDDIVIRKFIEATTAKDVATIRDRLLSTDYGLDQDVNFNCIECGSKQDGMIPLNENFFSPS